MKTGLVMKTFLIMTVLLFAASTVLGADPTWMGYSFTWVDHPPNTRFAIHDPGTPSDQTDDLVLDKMTGLIWMRNGDYLDDMINWDDAVQLCRGISACNIKGWRLPTVEELSTLIDISTPPSTLPPNHPFYGLHGYYYWTLTTAAGDSSFAWVVSFGDGAVFPTGKTAANAWVWPVLSGSGYASGNW